MSRAEQAADRAAQWIVLQEDGDWSEFSQAELDAWLAASDSNKAAYWRLKHSWREADRIGALGRSNSDTWPARPRISWRRWWPSAAVAASIAAIVGISSVLIKPAEPQEATRVVAASYSTPVGGRKTVGLPDGSRVQLNTASVARIEVSAQRREVWLDKGEAYFEVAHLAGRQFVVHAGKREITVLGTKFSIRRDSDKVTVAVIEGRVRVDEVGSRVGRPTIIVRGNIALAEGPSTLVVSRSEARVKDALAWRDGMLSFEQSSLADVAAEFNRYNSRQMIVADPEAANIRIGGIFPASSPSAFARLLRDAYGLRVTETQREIEISS